MSPFDAENFVIPVEVELEPWRKVLLDAAKEVRKGWLQGSCGWWDGDAPVCAGGAIMRVAKLDTWPIGHQCPEAWRQLETHLFVLGFDCIPSWNDASGRTPEEVASTMEKVAHDPR